MAVHAENARNELGSEAVHHRHDDDQRSHPEHDPDEEKPAMTEMNASFRRERR